MFESDILTNTALTQAAEFNPHGHTELPLPNTRPDYKPFAVSKFEGRRRCKVPICRSQSKTMCYDCSLPFCDKHSAKLCEKCYRIKGTVC